MQESSLFNERNAVCDACDEVLLDPLNADVRAIARSHGVALHQFYRTAPRNAQWRLSNALDDLEARVRNGEALRLMCWCSPARCHAEGIINILRQRLHVAN